LHWNPNNSPACMQELNWFYFNPFSVGTAFMLMQTGWIQASHPVTRQLAWDPTCLLFSPSFPIKIKQSLKVKSRRQYNLFLEIYPAFKGLTQNLLGMTAVPYVSSLDLNEMWSYPESHPESKLSDSQSKLYYQLLTRSVLWLSYQLAYWSPITYTLPYN